MRSFFTAGLTTLVAVIFLPLTPVFAQAPCTSVLSHATGISTNSPCLSTYDSSERLKDYFNRTVGLLPILKSAAAAGVNQARNSPSEWGGGTEGYGRRFGSSFGKRAISNTVQLGVEAMLGEDSRYVYSERSGFWPRLQDAVSHSVIIPTTDGGREFAVGRMTGSISGGLISRTWQPDHHRGVGNGFQSGGIAFGGYIAWNVFREFTRGKLPF